MTRTALLSLAAIVAAAALSLEAARAFPEGAPWGAADPAAERNCASCHFSREPSMDSPALHLRGLPARAVAGQVYALTVSLDDPGAATSGFQLIAGAVDQPAGSFLIDGDGIEAAEFITAVRSTIPLRNTDGVRWRLRWRAPARLDTEIVFHVAAAAANDDGSPLGDAIHFRSYRLPEKR